MLTVNDTSKKYANGNRETENFTVELIQCNKIHIEKNSLFRKINSSDYSLILIISGSVICEKNEIKAGNVISLPKFTKLKLDCKNTGEILVLNFNISKDVKLFTKQNTVIKASVETIEFFEKIYNLRYFKKSEYNSGEAYLLLILDTLENSFNFTSKEQKLYNTTCKFIEKNINLYLTPTFVANTLNCTVTHLNRIVRQQTGKSLGDVIAERRISEIKQQCKWGLNSSEISKKLDFSSPELLRKYFKYHTGISLKNYMSKNFQ